MKTSYTSFLLYTTMLSASGNLAWADTLPTSGVHSIALVNGFDSSAAIAELQQESFSPIGAPDSMPTVSLTANLPLTGLEQVYATATTGLGSNHALVTAYGTSGTAAALSAWYDQVVITDTAGTGTAQFTLQLDGSMATKDSTLYGGGLVQGAFSFYASTIHPTLLDADGIPDTNSFWELSAPESQLLARYEIFPTLVGNGVLEEINVTLTVDLNYTSDAPIYLIGGLALFATTNGPGAAATANFLNSGYVTGMSLPEGVTATFGSGTDYNNIPVVSIPEPVLSVPEPETYAMLLAGLGLVGFMAIRRKQSEA